MLYLRHGWKLTGSATAVQLVSLALIEAISFGWGKDQTRFQLELRKGNERTQSNIKYWAMSDCRKLKLAEVKQTIQNSLNKN